MISNQPAHPPPTITVVRTVPVPAERAFAAWTDTEQLAQWWWPQWPDTTYVVDATPGGTYRIQTKAVGVGISGTYTTVERPTTLAMTWMWENGGVAESDMPDQITVSFTPLGSGSTTEVTAIHEFAGDKGGGQLEMGWNHVMDRLPEFLARPA